MVLEFMDGGSLADLITKQGPQTEGNERRLAHSHTHTRTPTSNPPPNPYRHPSPYPYPYPYP